MLISYVKLDHTFNTVIMHSAIMPNHSTRPHRYTLEVFWFMSGRIQSLPCSKHPPSSPACLGHKIQNWTRCQLGTCQSCGTYLYPHTYHHHHHSNQDSVTQDHIGIHWRCFDLCQVGYNHCPVVNILQVPLHVWVTKFRTGPDVS